MQNRKTYYQKISKNHTHPPRNRTRNKHMNLAGFAFLVFLCLYSITNLNISHFFNWNIQNITLFETQVRYLFVPQLALSNVDSSSENNLLMNMAIYTFSTFNNMEHANLNPSTTADMLTEEETPLSHSVTDDSLIKNEESVDNLLIDAENLAASGSAIEEQVTNNELATEEQVTDNDLATEESVTDNDLATEEQATDYNLVTEESATDYELVINESINDYEITVDLEKITDVNYLISNYYIVDKTVSYDDSTFNPLLWIEEDLSLDLSSDGPKILIYHTHSQEDFTDSIPGDPSTTVVGVGAYLTELLNDVYNIETIHLENTYDLIDGVLDRSAAYEYAAVDVQAILEQYPSIEVVLDIHRDGVDESTHLVTMIDGKETAQIMYFNGLSSTVSNGSISTLSNPYVQDNLAFSFQMQLASESLYEGFTRRIYLKSYRYNLHLLPKAMLIEVGAQTNSLQEALNAMDILAEILSTVLHF